MMKSICLFLIIFAQLCRGQYSDSFNRRPSLHGTRSNLKGNDTNPENFQKQQSRIILPRTRPGSRMSRLHESLLRARMRQLSTQGFSEEQMKTETSSTASSSYTASHVHYLQRSVRIMTLTLNEMEVKVEKFEKWKTTSEERMAGLERIIERWQNEKVEEKDERLETASPSREEFELLKQQTQDNAATITNITEQLEEREFISKRQVDRNEKIQLQESHDSLETSSPLRTSSNEFTALSKKVQVLNDSVLIQKKIIEQLYSRVGKVQRCCRMNTYFAKRLGNHEKGIKEAREKSNNALKYLRIENSRIRSINSKLEDHKQKIQTLQDDVVSYNAIASHSNQRLIQKMESNLEEVNKTIQSVTGKGKGTLTHKIKSLEKRIAENSDTIISFAIHADEQMEQVNALSESMVDLKSFNEEEKRALVVNITRVERRVQRNKENAANIRVNMRRLRHGMRHINESIEVHSNILSQLSKSLQEDRANQIKELHDDITQTHASGELLMKQMKSMQTQVDNITAFDALTEEKIQMITGTIRKYEEQKHTLETSFTEKLKESETQLKINLANIRNDVNETFHSLQTEQNKSSKQLLRTSMEQEIKITKLAREMTKSNVEMAQFSESLDEFTDDASKKFSAIAGDQIKMREFVDRLALNLTGKVTKLEDFELLQRKNAKEMNNTIFLVSQTLEVLQLALEDLQNVNEITSIRKKIEQLHGMSHNLSEKIKIHESEVTSTRRKIESLTTVLETRSDHYEEIASDLAASTASLKEQFQNLTLQITTELEDIKEEGVIYNARVEKRIKDMMHSNKTIYDKLESHVREMNAVKEGMTSLQEKEDAVSDAISSFGNVIAEHDFVQRNLTNVSDKVKKTLQGQGLALKSIHKIMQQLNVSLIESQNSIDRSYFEQLKNQEGDIRAMRGLMQNFSSLLTKVFNDQLSHDVDHARISERQRTIVEKIDSCDAAIEEVKRTSETNSQTAESVKSNLMSNIDKLTALTTEVGKHAGKLKQIGKNTRNLLNLSKEFNSTKTSMENNITLIFERMSVAKQSESSDREEQNKKLLQLFRNVESLRQNVTRQEDKASEIRKKQHLMKANISRLMECREITTALQSRMSETESDINSLDKDLYAVKNEISTLSRNENVTKAEFQILRRKSQTLQTDSSKQKNIIKNLSSEVLKLQQKQNRINATISEAQQLLPEIVEGKKNVRKALNEIQEQRVKLQMLNASWIAQNETLEKLTSMTNSVSSTMKSLHTSNSRIISITQTMQDDIIKQDKRLIEMSEKIQDTEAKFTALNAAINKSEHKEAFQKTKSLEREVAKMKENLLFIAEDMDINYNATQNILDQLYDHDERIALINGETTALLSSLTSSVASLDSSLQNVNESVWYDINDLKELITDFQDAFDTSNRQRARYREEFEVFSSNASNRFVHLSTSLNYLTQIVRESNRAVDENRDRLDALNETMLFVRLSIPALLAPGIEDGMFEVKDSPNEDHLHPNTDLPDTASQQGSVREKVSGTERNIHGFNRKGSDYDRGTASNGDEDDFLTDRQVASWLALDDEYSENYDFGSLERRKRMAKEVRRIDHKMSDVLAKIEALQINVYRIGNETEDPKIFDTTTVRTAIDTTVAFSVGLTERFSCCGTVVFDKIFSNSGLGYDPSTGKFTAVRNGHYAFIMAVSERNSFVNAAVVWNNMPQVTVRMDHSAGHYEQSQSTNVVLLRLNVGDQVWLQTYAGALLGYQYPAVTFSGFLISG